MRLRELAPETAGRMTADAEIASLAYDSRRVQPGALFFCVSGFNVDGAGFAADALAAGAAALVVERELELDAPQLVVPSVRNAMGVVADRFYEHPSRELELIGVTGTNGKTTTTYLVRGLLEACGTQTGLLGTVQSIIAGRQREVERTTPEAIDLQADLRAMADGGDGACAMEVSSHALALGRVAGARFSAAVFTNLTQDHLDFHTDMEDYFRAKRLLFEPPTPPAPGVCVVNRDDPYGERLAAELPGAVTFSLAAEADYRADEVRSELTGASFTLDVRGERRKLRIPLPGRFNVQNALAALAVCHERGRPLEQLLDALERPLRVPGRFEPVTDDEPFAVLVDYAHTPDSLENVLAAARGLVEGGPGRVISVFGAGGDRDRTKRPLMGAASARLADITIVTSDNPRSEDPEAIIAEILSGTGPDVTAITDRREAIIHAVGLAREGDVLIIAGKGHEQGQEFAAGRKVPFDDVVVAREALAARRAQAA